MSRKKIDFKKYPYRGILTELASEYQCPRQNIYDKVKNGNPEILDKIATKIKERKNANSRFDRAIAG